jgi:bifunctional oligoribonuclease and PAP phosphatase NrnA
VSLKPPPPELTALLRERASFVLATHIGPDGDAMGSSLALYHALVAQGKTVQLVAPTGIAEHYRWLPGAEQFGREVSGSPEVAVIVDCDTPERLGNLREALLQLPTVADIDHHAGDILFGQVDYTDSTAAATVQLIFRLLQELQWPITPEIATCLYTGLGTDTGFFRFQNTSVEAFTDAAELVRLGAAPSQVAEAVGDTFALNRMRLRGRALASVQMDETGRIAYSILSPTDYRETGTSAGDTERIIDDLKQVAGQQAAVLFKSPVREDKWQVSLRSAVVDVAVVAMQFGGGGHARAAGCDVNAPLPEAVAQVLGAVVVALDGVISGAR